MGQQADLMVLSERKKGKRLSKQFNTSGKFPCESYCNDQETDALCEVNTGCTHSTPGFFSSSVPLDGNLCV